MAERQRDSNKMHNFGRSRAKQGQSDTHDNENSTLTQTTDTLSINSAVALPNPPSIPCGRSCRVTCSRRAIPKGKGLLLVFVIYFFESMAFFSALKGIRELLFKDESAQTWGSFVFTLLNHSCGRLFYPIAGIIADSLLGRYRVIHIGLWLMWTALAIVCLALPTIDIAPYSVGHIVLPILAILFISIGSGSVEVNTISFGVDQLPQGCCSDHISSFFFWYYFARNAASLLVNTIYMALLGSSLSFFPQDAFRYPAESRVDYHLKTLVVTVIAIALISVSLFFHIGQHHWYFKNKMRENPIKTVINVSWFSLTVKRHLPVYRRPFRYGEGKQPRIELAKIEYDGIFEAEEVENVKTFYQILFIIFSLGGFFASYGAAYSSLSAQFAVSGRHVLDKRIHYISSYFSQLVNVAAIVIFLPIINHLLIPFLPNMSLKLRLGSGVLLNVLALLTATFIQGIVQEDKNVSDVNKLLWLLLPAILLALGEALVFVTGLEFIYAQSPEPMKGLLTGLFYFAYGLFVGGSDVFFYYFPSKNIPEVNSALWFYVIFMIVAILALVAYSIVACLYRNRQRPSEDESDLVRRGYAQDVFG